MKLYTMFIRWQWAAGLKKIKAKLWQMPRKAMNFVFEITKFWKDRVNIKEYVHCARQFPIGKLLINCITLYEFIKKKTQLTQNEMVRKFPPVNRSFWYRRKTVSNIFNFVLFYSWHLIYKMCYIWSTKVLICMYISSIFFGGRVGELICKVQVFVSVGPILVTLSWHCNVVVFFLLKTDIFDDY